MKILANQESCIAAMHSAVLNRRQALLTEFAVGLAVLYGERKADIQAKKLLRSLYASVGYDCIDRRGADYVTIDRRVNAVAGLYDKIGRKRVLEWSAGKVDAEAITAISGEIEKLQLYTVRDVINYCWTESKEPKHREPPAHDRRADDRGFAYLVETPHIHIGIPPGVSSAELETAAKKLMALADKVRAGKVELRAA